MKKLIAILLAAMILLGLAACSANASKSDYEMPKGDYYETGGNYGSPAETGAGYEYNRSESGDALYGNTGGSGKSGSTAEAAGGQKLIRKIRLTVETDDYQAFVEALDGKIFELGGYVEDIEASTSGSYPYATITIRVPADRLSALTDSVAGIGNVTYKHESQQNVTLQYVDTESRISALRTEQDRLLELLDRADSLSEILEIEDRMTSVRYELESYERSLRALANQVEYATASIEVRQVRAFTPTEEVSYWENIRNGLADSLQGLWTFLKDAFSFLVIALPYLLAFLILPLIIVLVLLRRHSRKKKARLAAAGQLQQDQAPAETPEISEPRL